MTYYKKLLLIDDDADDHEFFLEAIHEIDSSINCTTYLDSEKALLELKESAHQLPDLIILDTNMPKLSGRQLLIALKEDSKLKEVPVVMYSTFFSGGTTLTNSSRAEPMIQAISAKPCNRAIPRAL